MIIGARELAGVGVALSIFNTVSKMVNVPLLAVTTSTVAAASGRSSSSSSSDAAAAATTPSHAQAKAVASAAASSISLAAFAGLAQACLLTFGGEWLAAAWGAPPSSLLAAPTAAFLTVRALGAPVTVLLLTLQGVFRGLRDTTTPLLATLLASVINVALCPTFIFGLGWGVKGAAAATVASQVGLRLWVWDGYV